VRALVIASLILALSAPYPCRAYETDQFSHRLDPISDSTEIMNQKVNDTLAEIVQNWRGPRDDWKFVQAVYHKLGGRHWVDHIERWAMNSPDIERLQPSRRESIYQGHPFWATRVAGIFGVGPTIMLNHQLIGSDKLGHFFSQGRKYYKRFLRQHSEVLAARQSAFTERAIFGQMTTGVYSNADLVANYEGYRFYRGLFEDDIVPGKPSILDWEGDHWVIQRPFSWADYVNAYWDEALNLNHYDSLLYPHMKARLQTFCPDYFAAPERYEIPDEEALKERYRFLQLRDTSDLRMDKICVDAPGQEIRGVAGQSH